MSVFNFVPTTSGKALFADVQAGAVLVPTKFAIGTGSLPAGTTCENLTALVSSLKEFDVSEKTRTPDGKCIFGGVFTNQDIANDFYLREIGLFAKAEYRDENGTVTKEVPEVLFICGNSGDTADLHPGQSGSGSILERKVRIPAYIGSEAAVEMSLNSGIYIASDEKGIAGGVATLGDDGKLAPAQRPSADDISALSTAGGTMTGDIDMTGKMVKGLGTPTADADAVNKAYADAIKKIAGAALPLLGGIMQGALNMGGFSLSHLHAPENDLDAATKAYVDAVKKIADAALPKTGGSVTGSMNVDGTVTASNKTNYSGFIKLREINEELYSLEIGISHREARGASISIRLKKSNGDIVSRVDAWENGTFTYSPDESTYYDIFNGSSMIKLVEGVHYGATLPAAGNKGRLFFRKVSE